MTAIHEALENRQPGNKGKSTSETSWTTAAHTSQPGKHCLDDVLTLMGTHELPGRSSFHPENFQSHKTFTLCPATPLHHQSLLPPGHWPRGLQRRLHQWVSCYPQALGFPRERFGAENSLSPLFLPLGPPRSLTAVQNHTHCFSPFQLFLYLRKDREIWCTTVRRHSFS